MRTRASVSVLGATLAALVAPGAALGANTDIFAVDDPVRAFTPADVTIEVADTVTWRWDSPQMFSSHNVFLGNPDDGNPDQEVPGCGPGGCSTTDAPISHQFNDLGAFMYYCALHPEMRGTVTVDENTTPDTTPPTTSHSLNPDPGPGGTATGPVTVTLSASDDDSGVAATEYRVDGGAFTAYAAPFTVDAVGPHTVEYRSTDNAGNAEAAKQVQFTIQAVPPDPPRDGTPPQAQPFVAAEKPERISVAQFRRKGLRVAGPCSGVESGAVDIRVKRSVARKLDLRKPLLARARVVCGVDGRFTAKPKPKGAARKALKGASGSIRATVGVEMSGPVGSADDTVPVVFTAAKRRGP